MKYRIIIIVLLFFVFLPANGYGEDAGDIICVDGKAPIAIDGELSDWEKFRSAPYQLEISNIIGVQKDEDVSTAMLCYADAENVYVAVEVHDDIPVFDDEVSNSMCDAVLIYFCTENASYSNLSENKSSFYLWRTHIPIMPSSSISIHISSDTSGKTIPVFYHGRTDFPYLSEALGIQSALKRGVDGYTVESTIPRRLLNITLPGETRITGMYIIVNDNYGGELYNRFLRSKTKGLGSLNISYPEDKVSAQKPSLAGEKQGLEEEFISPEQVSNQDVLYSVLQDISNQNWENAEKKLMSLDKTLWVNPILARVHLNSGNYDAALRTFSQVAEESPDRYARFWAKKHLADIYMYRKKDDNAARKVNKELLSSSNPYLYGDALYRLVLIELNNFDYKTAVTVFDEAMKKRPLYTYRLGHIAAIFGDFGNYEKAIEIHENAISSAVNFPPEIQQHIIESSLMSIAYTNSRQGKKSLALARLREILDRYPGLPPSLRLAENFEQAGGYDEALEIYENIKQSGEETNDILNARIGIARTLYFKGDYERAVQLSEELISEKLTDEGMINSNIEV